MTDERPDQEPASAQGLPAAPAPKGRQSLARVRRELDEAELASPAVQRLLVDEIERLERACIEAEGYRDRFHGADKLVAVQEERLKRSLGADIVFGASLSIGSGALAYAPTLWNHQPSGWIVLIMGGVLLIGGIAFRVVQR